MIYVAVERVGLASFGEVEGTLTRFRSVFRTSMPDAHVEMMLDLVALSAAELRLVAASIGQRPKFPVMVRVPTLMVALAKTDTLPSWECTTPDRIAGGGAQLGDCFVFSGDLDKAHLAIGTLASFREKFVGYVREYVERMTMTPVGREISIGSEAYFAEALIWRARLDVFEGHQDPERTERTLREVAKALDVSHLLSG